MPPHTLSWTSTASLAVSSPGSSGCGCWLRLRQGRGWPQAIEPEQVLSSVLKPDPRFFCYDHRWSP